MTVKDITPIFPSFKKTLRRINHLKNKVDYLKEDELIKTAEGCYSDRIEDLLFKAEQMEQEGVSLQFHKDPSLETEENFENLGSNYSEENKKKILPKIESAMDIKWNDIESPVSPQLTPEENYAGQKYSRITEKFATDNKDVLNTYKKRILEASMSPSEENTHVAIKNFAGIVATYEMKKRIERDGLLNSLKWLNGVLGITADQKDNKEFNPFKFTSSFGDELVDDELKEALSEKDTYRNGYFEAMSSLYDSLTPEFYKTFVENSDDQDESRKFAIVRRAIEDLPTLSSDSKNIALVQKAVRGELTAEYGEENAKKVFPHIDHYIKKNYKNLKLDSFKKPRTTEQREQFLEKFKDSDSLQSVLKLQGLKGNEMNRLSLDLIGEKEMPTVINKFIAELKSNPKFANYEKNAEVIAAKLFGEAYGKYYNPKATVAFIRSNPHYIKGIVGRLNDVLINKYNKTKTVKDEKLQPIIPRGEDGELTKEDVYRINKFIKRNGQKLVDFVKENYKEEDYGKQEVQDLLKLRKMVSSGGISYLSDRNSNAATYLDNILTDIRGMTKAEKRLGKKFYREGIAYFANPFNPSEKIHVKDFLQSPMFLDPELLSEFLLIEKRRALNTTGSFKLMVDEIMPLITGAYYNPNRKKVNPDGTPVSAEELAVEDFLNNPFIARINKASQSKEEFVNFINFLKAAASDLGVSEKGNDIFDVGALNGDIVKFVKNATVTDNVTPMNQEDIQILKQTPKTKFEELVYKAPKQHYNTMVALKNNGWKSGDEEIDKYIQTYAAPVFDKYFESFWMLDKERYNGANIEDQLDAVRKELINELNYDMASTLFEEKGPFNYFSDVDKVDDKEMKYGIQEAAYILKKLDPEFYNKVKNAKVSERGIDINSLIVPTVIQPEEQVQQVQQAQEPQSQPVEASQMPVQAEPTAPVATQPIKDKKPRKEQIPNKKNREDVQDKIKSVVDHIARKLEDGKNLNKKEEEFVLNSRGDADIANIFDAARTKAEARELEHRETLDREIFDEALDDIKSGDKEKYESALNLLPDRIAEKYREELDSAIKERAKLDEEGITSDSQELLNVNDNQPSEEEQVEAEDEQPPEEEEIVNDELEETSDSDEGSIGETSAGKDIKSPKGRTLFDYDEEAVGDEPIDEDDEPLSEEPEDLKDKIKEIPEESVEPGDKTLEAIREVKKSPFKDVDESSIPDKLKIKAPQRSVDPDSKVIMEQIKNKLKGKGEAVIDLLFGNVKHLGEPIKIKTPDGEEKAFTEGSSVPWEVSSLKDKQNALFNIMVKLSNDKSKFGFKNIDEYFNLSDFREAVENYLPRVATGEIVPNDYRKIGKGGKAVTTSNKNEVAIDYFDVDDLPFVKNKIAGKSKDIDKQSMIDAGFENLVVSSEEEIQKEKETEEKIDKGISFVENLSGLWGNDEKIAAKIEELKKALIVNEDVEIKAAELMSQVLDVFKELTPEQFTARITDVLKIISELGVDVPEDLVNRLQAVEAYSDFGASGREELARFNGWLKDEFVNKFDNSIRSLVLNKKHTASAFDRVRDKSDIRKIMESKFDIINNQLKEFMKEERYDNDSITKVEQILNEVKNAATDFDLEKFNEAKQILTYALPTVDFSRFGFGTIAAKIKGITEDSDRITDKDLVPLFKNIKTVFEKNNIPIEKYDIEKLEELLLKEKWKDYSSLRGKIIERLKKDEKYDKEMENALYSIHEYYIKNSSDNKKGMMDQLKEEIIGQKGIKNDKPVKDSKKKDKVPENDGVRETAWKEKTNEIEEKLEGEKEFLNELYPYLKKTKKPEDFDSVVKEIHSYFEGFVEDLNELTDAVKGRKVNDIRLIKERIAANAINVFGETAMKNLTTSEKYQPEIEQLMDGMMKKINEKVKSVIEPIIAKPREKKTVSEIKPSEVKQEETIKQPAATKEVLRKEDLDNKVVNLVNRGAEKGLNNAKTSLLQVINGPTEKEEKLLAIQEFMDYLFDNPNEQDDDIMEKLDGLEKQLKGLINEGG